MAQSALQPDSFQLTPNDVHVWCVGLDVSSAASARLYASLTREERNRSARLRFERDRQRFIVAHGVLHDLMGRYLDTPPDGIAYGHNAFGKPGLHAKLGSRLKFNLSHSAGLALIAVTTDANVGIDLEYVRAQSDFADIARLFFAAAEADYLMALPSHLRAEAFFGCWTKKEAYLKACGEGLAIPLDSFSVPLMSDPARTRVDFLVASNDIGPAKRWSMYSLAPAPGYIGALVIEGAGWRLRQWSWEMPSGRNVTAMRMPA